MENKKLASYQQNQNRGQKIKLEITKYIRYWPFILGVLFISLSVVFVQLRYTKKMYQSNAKIRILSNSKGLELPEAGFIFSKPNINLENNIEIIKSSKIWEELVVDLNLVTSFYQYGSVLLTEVSQIPFSYTPTLIHNPYHKTKLAKENVPKLPMNDLRAIIEISISEKNSSLRICTILARATCKRQPQRVGPQALGECVQYNSSVQSV